MQLVNIKNAVLKVIRDVDENHTMAFAAALSHYFVLSLFPLLIFMSALVAYVPIPGVFNQILGMLARVVPPDSMGLVRKILADVVLSRHGSLLTFGIVFTIWSSSSGLAAMIEALNVAYDVPETRRIWTTRALAIGLTFLIGFLLLVALGVLIAGPKFGGWLAEKIEISQVFVAVWPFVRWSVAIGFTVVAVELLYFWGPNIRQKFQSTLPGAVIAVAGWIGLSYLLGIYFRHFAHYNTTYGTLGAAIALSVWFYWTSFIILVGAEFNSRLLQEVGEERLLLKDRRRTVTSKPPSETDVAA
jgi:membrane protein